MNTSIVEAVVEQLRDMPQHLQWQVLEFARALVKAEVRGSPGQQLLGLAGGIALAELQQMSEAIEQGCERVDINEW